MGLSSILSNSASRVSILYGSSLLIEFDASLKEGHRRESPPTEYEIENGQVISDHVILRPFHLTLQVMTTDTPISLVSGLITAGISAVLPKPSVLGAFAPALALAPALFGQSDSYDPLTGENGTDSRPSNQIYETLLTYQASRLPFNIFTTLKLYKNMWIKDITVPRNSSTGRQATFDIELVQLLLVSPTSVNLGIFSNAAVAAAQVATGSASGDNELANQAKQGYANGDGLATVVPK